MSKKIIGLLLALLMLVGLMSVSAFAVEAEAEAQTQTEEVALDGFEAEALTAALEADDGEENNGVVPEDSIVAETPSVSVSWPDDIYEYIVGDDATTLTVTASVSDGGALSYQWYRSLGFAQLDWFPIDGAQESSYTPSTETAGTYNYYCKVTNALTVDGVVYPASTNTAYARIVVNADKPVVTLGTGGTVTVTADQIAAGYDIPVYIKATGGVSSYSLVTYFSQIAWTADPSVLTTPTKETGAVNRSVISWSSEEGAEAINSDDAFFYIHLQAESVAEGEYLLEFASPSPLFSIGGSTVDGIETKNVSLTINVVADSGEVVTGLLGDANGDGDVDVNDATLVLQYYVGSAVATQPDLTLSNVNGDSLVDVNDATAILQYYVTGSSKYPIGTPVG